MAGAERFLERPRAKNTPTAAIKPGNSKRPADVITRLAQCVELVRSIAEAEGLPALQLRLDESSLEAVSPSDVYDIATLLVAELAYLDRTSSLKSSAGLPTRRLRLTLR